MTDFRITSFSADQSNSRRMPLVAINVATMSHRNS